MQTQQAPERFLRINDVTERTKLGRATVWDRSRKGTFPKPIKIGARTTVWKESEVDHFIRTYVH